MKTNMYIAFAPFSHSEHSEASYGTTALLPPTPSHWL